MGHITKKQKQRIRYYLKAKSAIENKKEIIHSGNAPKYIARHVPFIRRLAKNLDRLLIVSSFVEPPLKTGLIDRFLVLAELEQIDPVICLNKVDLLQNIHQAEKIAEIYRKLNYRVILTSAKTRQGMEQFKAIIKNHDSALVGHSGVGKSSLLNTIAPHLELSVNKVSPSTKKGRHTTSKIRVHTLDETTRIMDMPGIKLLDFIDIHYDEARLFYREFERYAPFCKFRDCQHITEKQCAVKDALEKGEINPLRYESYLNLVESLKNFG